MKQKEGPESPGLALIILALFFGVPLILANLDANPLIALGGLLLIFFGYGLGAGLNRLERIAHHLERLRSEQKEIK
ncbi:MAG: hypothetical protein LLF76_08060 [Planctomycetaceae bacterium]|nr:hypothetical protein [Planctomycetaceae bacterium]